jgi:hypothetical protein
VRHADYIASWLEVLREDDRAIVRAASAASKAADFILGFQPDASQPVAATSADDDRRRPDHAVMLPGGFQPKPEARHSCSRFSGFPDRQNRRVRGLRRFP